MPELPEVETTRRGIAPYVEQQTVRRVLVREQRLRWPVPTRLNSYLKQQRIVSVRRRGKYLLFHNDNGCMLLHLGMSGKLFLVDADRPVQKHDHIDFEFSNNLCLRLNDPRRFGSIHWTRNDPLQHKLLANLGPEPLSKAFTTDYLKLKAVKRKTAIKSFIMDSHIVVGVGNIYANEALFKANIDPERAAGAIGYVRLERLVAAIKQTLRDAIKAGGTTLRDFRQSSGKPGYFSQQLLVYGRGGEPCLVCGNTLREIRLGQRTTVYCGRCQR